MSKVQSGWRSCPKCQGMFYAGFPGKGVCPAGGQHNQDNSFAYGMEFDSPGSDTDQTAWAACAKCQGMFFAGFPQKGVCPAGGEHDQTNSFAYEMLHDLSAPNTQSEFRSCAKCQGLFYGPLKGVCPAGGEHSQEGSFNYAVRVQSLADTVTFDAGPLTSDLALGGSATLLVRKNGDFTVNLNGHDSGADNIDFVIVAVLMTTTGVAFTFQHTGSLGGILPPSRDDPYTQGGNNIGLTNEFEGMAGAKFQGKIRGKDTLVAGIEGLLGDLVKEVAQDLIKGAAKAVVALVIS